MIIFDEPTHTYTNPEKPNLKYSSVTTILGYFKKFFDADRIAGYVAKKRGITVEEVLAEWDKLRDDSCVRGTKIHKIMEDYINGETPIDNSAARLLYDSYDKCVADNIGSYEKVTAEMLLHDDRDDKFGLAGLADLIYDIDDSTFMIGDFKTNKEFNYTSKYKNKMLHPIEQYEECEHTTYSLQLSIYANLYARQSGKTCKGSWVWYMVNGEWTPIQMLNLTKQTDEIIEFYFKNYAR